VFIRREDAERFIDEVRGDGPNIAAKLRIEERELEGTSPTPAASFEQPSLEAWTANP
jgi:hypothetical protein